MKAQWSIYRTIMMFTTTRTNVVDRYKYVHSTDTHTQMQVRVYIVSNEGQYNANQRAVDQPATNDDTIKGTWTRIKFIKLSLCKRTQALFAPHQRWAGPQRLCVFVCGEIALAYKVVKSFTGVCGKHPQTRHLMYFRTHTHTCAQHTRLCVCMFVTLSCRT